MVFSRAKNEERFLGPKGGPRNDVARDEMYEKARKSLLHDDANEFFLS
jgi:hypothetical protein